MRGAPSRPCIAAGSGREGVGAARDSEGGRAWVENLPSLNKVGDYTVRAYAPGLSRPGSDVSVPSDKASVVLLASSKTRVGPLTPGRPADRIRTLGGDTSN